MTAGSLGGRLAQVVPAGAKVLLFLPNVPVWVRVLLAVLGAGRQPVLVDPRRPPEELEPALVEQQPALIVTIDIGTVMDKLLQLQPAVPHAEIRVARFATELPFPRNLLFPLLRGGGLANLPNDPRFARLETAPATSPDPDRTWSGPLVLPTGEIQQAELVADSSSLRAQAGLEERWLLATPLASRTGLTALFAALQAGPTLVMTPRLDRQSLEKIERLGRIDRRLD